MAPKAKQTSKKEQVAQVKAIVKDLVDLAETKITKETPSPSRSRAGSTSDIELKLAREELEKMRTELATAALGTKEAESKLKVSQESMDKFSSEMQAAITRTETAQSQLKLVKDLAATESARAAELAKELEVSKASREADAKAAAAEIAKEREVTKSGRALHEAATKKLQELEAKHAAELDFEQSKVSFVAEELEVSKATREADSKNAAARLQDLDSKHVALLDMAKSKASSMAQNLEASKSALEANLTELALLRQKSSSTAEELESLKKSMAEKAAESEKVMYCMTTKYDYQLSQVKDLKLSQSALTKEAAETTVALNGIKGTFAFKLLSAVGCSK